MKPSGQGFGWDPIFSPDGSELSFGAMSFDQKQDFSMRRLSLDALLEKLDR